MPEGKFNVPAQIGVTVPHSNVDAYYGPYSSLDEARAKSNVVKADGLTVAVKGTDKVTEYWWVNGELVEKLSSSTKDYPVLHHKLLQSSGNTSVYRWIKVAYVNQLNIYAPATMWFLFNRGYMVGANESTNCATLGCLYFGAGARTNANAQLFVMRNPELWKIKTTKVSGNEWAAEIYYNSGVTEQGTYVDLTVLMNIDNGSETDYKQKEDATRWKVPERFSFEAEPTGDETAAQPSYVHSAYLFYSATDTKYTAGTNVQINSNNVISATDTKYTATGGLKIDSSNVIKPTGGTANYLAYWNGTNSIAATDVLQLEEEISYYNLPGIKVNGALEVIKNAYFEDEVHIDENLVVCESVQATSFLETSDRRLKDDIEDAEIELEDIDKIPVVNFHYKGRDGWQLGTIAQDVQDLFPELVSEGKDGYLSVDYSKLACVAVAGVKKLKEENRKLQDKMLLMEQTTDILLRRIDMLEKRIK